MRDFTEGGYYAYDVIYRNLIQGIIDHGRVREDRTGIGTLSMFGASYHFNFLTIDEKTFSYPLLQLKNTHLKSVAEELFWMISGETNVTPLNEKGVTIWDEWADEFGDLGPIYGAQWRTWRGISIDGDFVETDQLVSLVDGIKNNPYSRRHVLSTWNVTDLPDEESSPQANVSEGKMALAPCHVMIQCYVDNGKLDMLLTQRSCDAFLGLPFNTAGYSLFQIMLALECGLRPGTFHHSIGDLHLYKNHLQAASEVLRRHAQATPTLTWNGEGLFSPTFEDIVLSDYNPHPSIKVPVAV